MKYLKTILLFVFCININIYATEKKSNDLKEAFLDFLKKGVVQNPINGLKPIISLYFYTLNNNEYFRIVPYNGFFSNSYKGIYETDEFIIFYYGFNEELALRYLCFNSIDLSDINNKYHNLDNSDIDIDPKNIQYYKIKNKSEFERFYPDKQYEDDFENYLYKIGYLIMPPPPPVED